MKKLLARRSSVTAVVAAAAVLTVFGTGTAVAGGLITSAKIKNNTVKSIDVRNNNLKGVDVRDGSLTGADVADGSLTGADVANGSLSNHDVGVFHAVVGDDGTLADGSAGVTSSRTSTGVYRVRFGQDISHCAFVATVGRTGDGSTSGTTNVADLAGAVDGVFLRTTDLAGAAADRPFHLVVAC